MKCSSGYISKVTLLGEGSFLNIHFRKPELSGQLPGEGFLRQLLRSLRNGRWGVCEDPQSGFTGI